MNVRRDRVRPRWIVRAGAAAAVAAVAWLAWSAWNRSAPSPYRWVKGPVTLPARLQNVTYDSRATNPFPGGRMWIHAADVQSSPTREAYYLFNLDSGRIEGEGAKPIVADATDTVRVYGNDDYGSEPWFLSEIRDWLVRHDLMARPTSGGVQFYVQGRNQRTSQLLVVRYNVWLQREDERLSRQVVIPGEIMMWSGGPPPPDIEVSPQGGYAILSAGLLGSNHPHLIDFKRNQVKQFDLPHGAKGGWWSDHELLLYEPTGDLKILDVVSSQTSTLLSSGEVDRYLTDHNLPTVHNRRRIGIYPVWAGDHYEFFMIYNDALALRGPPWLPWYPQPAFSDLDRNSTEPTDRSIQNRPSGWLLKIARPGKKLELVTPLVSPRDPAHTPGPSFIHGGLGLNPEGTLLVNDGPEDAPPSGVFIFDFRTSRNTKLVTYPPSLKDPMAPRFYRDKIIYSQPDSLWIMNADGSTQHQIFPPPAAPAGK